MLVEEVTAISSYGDEVWFGTNDGIACYHRGEDRWEGFPAAHNPTGGLIHTILADSRLVWVGMDDGVLKYVKEEKRWHRYTMADGLMDNAVRWILLDGDYVWFGTGRGLTRFFWNAPHLID
jgi:ligand-binding sensor domain-containing protein